jgi:uncharacterized protein involved in exopolysaccharide biosynthesis
MTDSPLFQTSFRDLVAVFFRRLKGISLIVIAALSVATAWQVFLHEPLYIVTAKMLVRIGQEQAVPVTMLGEKPPVVGYRQQDVTSEVEILKNATLLGKVVDELQLDRQAPASVPEKLIPRLRYELKRAMAGFKELTNEALIATGFRQRLTPREQIIAMLDEGLAVYMQGDSNVIVAQLALPMREGAAEVLNTLVRLYLDSRRKLFQDTGAVELFARQAVESEAELEQAERALSELETRTDIVSLGVQQELLLQRIADAQARLDEDRLAYEGEKAKLERLRMELELPEVDLGAFGSFRNDSLQEGLLRELASLQREREQLRMTEFDESVRSRNNRQQFSMLAGMLLSNLESAVAEGEATVRARESVHMRLQDRLDALHRTETEWHALKRKIDLLDERYRFYQRKHEDAAAALAIEQGRIGNVVVVQHALDPIKPAGLRKLTLLMLTAVLAVFAALAWATLAEFFDHRIHGAEALATHLGVDAVVTAPDARGRRG